MYQLTVERTISAAHWLRGYPGPCANPHGHTFRILVSVEGEKLNSLGMLMDFAALKAEMKTLVENKLDHHMLNEVYPFTELNPTAENLAQVIYHMHWDLPFGIRVSKVTVYESDDSCASYWEEKL